MAHAPGRSRLDTWIATAAPYLALGLAALIAFVAVRWGAFVAGGSDSYCYVGQARMWLDGSILRPLEPGFDPPWPNAALSLAPTGFVPSQTIPGGIAPICPPGLSVMMAALAWVGGERAMFAIVPVAGALCVWCAFVLARRMSDAPGGLLAAALTAASPILLHQVVQPMSDVPAAALWLLAMAPAARGSRGSALGAGLASALAILVRPNLAPLVVPVALLAAAATAAAPGADGAAPSTSRGENGASRSSVTAMRGRLVNIALVSVGALPGVLAVAFLNHLIYGSPLRSGYGAASQLFAVSHIVPNLARYPGWLIESHTVWILLGLVAPFVLLRQVGADAAAAARAAASPSRWNAGAGAVGAPPRATAWACLLLVALGLALYLVYVPFQDWQYLRFLLPAVVVMIVLASATTSALARRLPPLAHVLVVIAIGAVLSTTWVRFAKVHYAFDLQASEQRFVETARWIDGHVPRPATVFASWHSGSVRYYGQRLSLMWDAIPPDQLDAAIDYLQRIDRPPFAVFEPWELDAFRARFRGHSAFGGLDWPPRAQIGTQVQVFDFTDRARYFSGQPVPTERVWTAAERRALRRR